ncbi:hypothetical protein F4802DRAFT_262789 [Xylaria palmicola]|nr:hypothetical protein F4802DRAFT_262789 [Xylaria palmicola]
MTRHQQPRPGQPPIHNERNSLGRPQLFVQLTFGVSWSDRHLPSTHTLSYTSKNLKAARDSGHFPRQDSYHQHRRQDSSSFQRQSRGHSQHHHHHHHRDPERTRGRAGHSRPRHHHPGTLSPPRRSRSDSRLSNAERGSSAPPVIHDGPWRHDDDDEGGPSATLFPRPVRTARQPPHVWKDLPTNPARFRLGEDGLPWSASAWPFDADANADAEDEEDGEPPFANLPTTLPLSPPNRRHSEDPQRARDLESLSTAMVTVDNGFENQWWNQGTREPTAWSPPDDADPDDDDDARPLSAADALLLSAAEPPSGVETYSPISGSFRDLVSPLSDLSPAFHMSSPIQRVCSTRSDELWMDR